MHMVIYMYNYALQSHQMVTHLWKGEIICFSFNEKKLWKVEMYFTQLEFIVN